MSSASGRIGVIGDGQLGRMLALAARPLGADVVCVGRDGPTSPAAPVCDEALRWSDDAATLVCSLAERVDVVTFEFESVPADLLDALGSSDLRCRPGPAVVATAADRGSEKALFVASGVPTVEHRVVTGADEAVDAADEIDGDVVVKTVSGGYDGKGQVAVRADAGRDDTARAARSLGSAHMIVEERVDLAAEWSVVVCRAGGRTEAFDAFGNVHADHVLDTSVCPASVAVADAVSPESAALHTRTLADAVDLVGVMCVEFFVTTDGRLLANEIAPRPHNSGHLTIEAAATSQFEQQARIALDLPIGPTELRRPAAMANLLGDLWSPGRPDLAAALAAGTDERPTLAGDLHLHLYGKAEARPGRKMGHLTALADDPQEALSLVLDARAALAGRPSSTP